MCTDLLGAGEKWHYKGTILGEGKGTEIAVRGHLVRPNRKGIASAIKGLGLHMVPLKMVVNTWVLIKVYNCIKV